MADKNEKKQVTIELPEDIAQGVYTSLVIVNHSQTEFVLDFISMMPGMPKAKVKSRIILTPPHAKRLLAVLDENVKKYESQFGEIKDIGKKMEDSISKYFYLANLNDPTVNFDWEYILIDNKKMKNAWCMPGGKIYLLCFFEVF